MTAITFDQDFLTAIHHATPDTTQKQIAVAAGLNPKNFARSLMNHRKAGLVEADTLQLTIEGARLADVAPTREPNEATSNSPGLALAQGATSVPLFEIAASDLNPRKTFDEDKLRELANSLFEKGQLQNLVVRPFADPKPGEARFELVAGERRWRAFNLLASEQDIPGDHPVKIEVRDLTDIEVLEIAVTENSQREDVHPLEEAEAIARLQEARLAEGSKSDARAVCRQIAEKVGRTERWAQQRVNIVKRLSPKALEAFRNDVFTSVKWADEIGRWPHELQDQVVDVIRDRDWETIDTLDDLKEWFRGEAIPVGKQSFDIQEYLDAGGTLSEADEDGDVFMVNSGVAKELAANHALNQIEDLTAEHEYSKRPVIENWRSEYSTPAASELKPKPPKELWFALAVVDRSTLETEIFHPVVSRQEYDRWNAKKANASLKKEDGTDAAKPLAKGVWKRGAIARTNALREAIADDAFVAMALTVVTLANSGSYYRQTMVRLDIDRPTGEPGDVGTGVAFKDMVIQKRVPGFNRKGELESGPKALQHLIKNTTLAADLFAALIADVTIDCTYDCSPGAMPEAVAMAHANLVQDPGGDLVDNTWTKKYTKAQQAVIIDAYDLFLDVDDMAAMKKADADDKLANQIVEEHKPIEARFIPKEKALELEARLLKGEKL